jgi:hypothetical protein
MPVKKASAAKTPSAAKKPRAARKTSKGENYVCELCGLSVIVDDCGYEEVHEIICCEQPMKKRATKAKAAK